MRVKETSRVLGVKIFIILYHYPRKLFHNWLAYGKDIYWNLMEKHWDHKYAKAQEGAWLSENLMIW